MLVIQIAVTILFTILLITLSLTTYYAIKERYLAVEVRLHRTFAGMSLWIALGAILLTEVMVRFNGGVQSKELLIIHLSFAIPFLISLILLRFWLTGTRYPYHRTLGYTCLFSYIGTFITGMILIVKIRPL